jgi:hypothetical protein
MLTPTTTVDKAKSATQPNGRRCMVNTRSRTCSMVSHPNNHMDSRPWGTELARLGVHTTVALDHSRLRMEDTMRLHQSRTAQLLTNRRCRCLVR